MDVFFVGAGVLVGFFVMGAFVGLGVGVGALVGFFVIIPFVGAGGGGLPNSRLPRTSSITLPSFSKPALS